MNMRGMMMGRTGKLFLTLAILWNAGCSSKPSSSTSSSGNPTGITVSVFPSATSVVVGQTVPFTATVTGTTNTAVNWEVAGVAGGKQPTPQTNTSGGATPPHAKCKSSPHRGEPGLHERDDH